MYVTIGSVPDIVRLLTFSSNGKLLFSGNISYIFYSLTVRHSNHVPRVRHFVSRVGTTGTIDISGRQARGGGERDEGCAKQMKKRYSFQLLTFPTFQTLYFTSCSAFSFESDLILSSRHVHR